VIATAKPRETRIGNSSKMGMSGSRAALVCIDQRSQAGSRCVMALGHYGFRWPRNHIGGAGFQTSTKFSVTRVSTYYVVPKPR